MTMTFETIQPFLDYGVLAAILFFGGKYFASQMNETLNKSYEREERITSEAKEREERLLAESKNREERLYTILENFSESLEEVDDRLERIETKMDIKEKVQKKEN